MAFDPWQVTAARPVDLVFVTHGHEDHCDPVTVSRLVKDGATIVAAAACADRLPGDVRPLSVGQVLTVGRVVITVVDAYNLRKSFHPKGEGVGFLVAVDEGTIFHAGDTDDIPETHGLKPDVALLPVGGTYTMDVAEAARAAAALGAALTIPMHFGYIVGSPEDGTRFAREASVPVSVLTPAEPFPGEIARNTAFR